MAEKRDNLDPIELAMLDLEAAERAGVMRPTPLSAADAAGSNHSVHALRRPWFMQPLPIAATVALAACVWGVMFQAQIRAVKSGQAGTADLTALHMTRTADVVRCVEGPTGAAPMECGNHDSDADGDVDLQDFSRYQLAFAAPGRSR